MQRSDENREVFLAWVDRGAARAASAFSKLAGRPIGHESPKVALSDCDFPASDAGEWSTGVFFRLEGCLDAWIGILFHQAASEAIVRRVVGMPEGVFESGRCSWLLARIARTASRHCLTAEDAQNRLEEAKPTRIDPAVLRRRRIDPPWLPSNHVRGRLSTWGTKTSESKPLS